MFGKTYITYNFTYATLIKEKFSSMSIYLRLLVPLPVPGGTVAHLLRFTVLCEKYRSRLEVQSWDVPLSWQQRQSQSSNNITHLAHPCTRHMNVIQVGKFKSCFTNVDMDLSKESRVLDPGGHEMPRLWWWAGSPSYCVKEMFPGLIQEALDRRRDSLFDPDEPKMGF